MMESESRFRSSPGRVRGNIDSSHLFGSQRLVGPGDVWVPYKPGWGWWKGEVRRMEGMVG